MTPREWRAEPVDDRAIMLASFLFEATLTSYQQEYREERRNREESKNKEADDYRRLKDRMK